MNRRVIAWVITFFFFLTSWGYSFAGGVTDDNNGNLGNIFLSTGQNQGANSVGHWADITSVPELKGVKGDTGQQGIGIDGKNGAEGKTGTNGKDGQSIQGERGKGLKNQYKVGIEFRILDTKHTTWATYMNRDFNNGINEVGVKLTIKLGKSYELRKIEELERKLK
jgi:hypothetical protein